ncbi:MAG: glycosyltransferase [Paludibacter sp.]|nr:glycosyltransferase [Paludibacter sp.]
MKKVLIITYYWIPSGGAGVQRWVKFAKYLRDFGWEPIIYTPENPEYSTLDDSFAEDIPTDVQVIKTPIWEPYNIYRNLFGKNGQTINPGFISEDKKAGWKEKLSVWIRGNFLIPDPRKFWISPSVKFLKNYLLDHPVDAVITTGPPHSMHLIAYKLKKHFPRIPWIADFRDPWTNIDYYEELNLTKFADKRHQYLEQRIVRSADSVVVVSNGMLQEFSHMNPKALCVIPNGYDDKDVRIKSVELDKHFTISHIGTLNVARNPSVIWEALHNLCEVNAGFKADLRIQLIGKIDFTVLEDIKRLGLNKNLIKVDYVTHAKAIVKQQSSQLLLLLINRTANAKGILTGKFFEYLASKRPVLGVGPTDGDAAYILQETNAGIMIGFDDLAAAEKSILNYYQLFQKNELILDTLSVERFSRRNLTEELSNLLNQLTAHA